MPSVDPVPKQTLALKGPNNLAQGNALVLPHKSVRSSCHRGCAVVRGEGVAANTGARSPVFTANYSYLARGLYPRPDLWGRTRALSWAKLLRPFQGKGEKRNFKTGASGLLH